MPTYWPAVRYGGPIYSVHELCKALRSVGHEVHVFTTNVDGDKDIDVPIGQAVDVDGVKVWYFPSRVGRRLYYSPRMKSALRERVREFDVVHMHSVFLWSTWAAASAARKAGVPYMLSPRGMLLKDLVYRKSRWKKSLWIRLIERANLRNAARIHVTSRLEGAGLREFGFDLPSMVAIPNGVSLPGETTSGTVSDDVAGIARAGGYVLYLGRINWKKRLDRLVDVWRTPVDARLVVAGNDEEGCLAELRQQMDRGNIENITFIPRFVADTDKASLFQNAAVFVLASYSENFGNTVLEAMAFGVPVVVTEEVGAREVVEASGGGRVVPIEQLGAAIRELLSDPERRREIGRKGRDFVAENLSWEHVAREMEGAYRDMAAA